jgi:hypothetical protein
MSRTGEALATAELARRVFVNRSHRMASLEGSNAIPDFFDPFSFLLITEAPLLYFICDF